MNRFKVIRGQEAAFEASWRNRETYLERFDGFIQFSLLRNEAEGDAQTEFISHTTWRSRADFEVWRGSEEFRRAHAQGSVAGVLAGPPQASLYDAVLRQEKAEAAPAVEAPGRAPERTLQEVLDESARTAGPAMRSIFAREDRRLSAEEFREYWRQTRMFAVATVGRGGAPHIAPVHVLLRDDDALEMAIYEDSLRLADLRRNPRIAITTWAEDGRTAIVYGRAEEVPSSRREVNPGGNPEQGRTVVMMRIRMSRAYAMSPRRQRPGT
jgi:heme-degrading monooxygenase HmoA